MDILGYKLFSGGVSDIDYCENKRQIINTMNPRVYTIARYDKKLKQAFLNTDYLIMDGQYFMLAPLILKGKLIRKISGTKMMFHLLDLAQKKKLKVFFFGASDETLDGIKLKLSLSYPDIKLQTFSPPYKKEFTVAENDEFVKVINQFCPDILFVGLTAPKQEIWVDQHKNDLDANMICSVGAAFDWLAGTRKMPGKFWVKFGLEWLHRTIERPAILKRYPEYIAFFYLFIWDALRQKKR